MLDRVTKLVISLLFFYLDRIARMIFKLGRKHSPGTLVVLTYHAVKPHQREKFEKQMNLLLKSGKAVRADVGSHLPDGTHHIAVTFDDGFQSILENALPVLSKWIIPFTVFVPTGFIGRGPGWIENPGHENYGEIVLTEDQLKRLADQGGLVGSHGITHPKLKRLDLKEAKKEILDSKTKLESILRREILLFSFPYNDFNNRLIELAKEAGYMRVFANVPTYPTSQIDRFLLGRIDVKADDWGLEYWLKLKGAYQWLPLAIWVKDKFRMLHNLNRNIDN